MMATFVKATRILCFCLLSTVRIAAGQPTFPGSGTADNTQKQLPVGLEAEVVFRYRSAIRLPPAKVRTPRSPPPPRPPWPSPPPRPPRPSPPPRPPRPSPPPRPPRPPPRPRPPRPSPPPHPPPRRHPPSPPVHPLPSPPAPYIEQPSNRPLSAVGLWLELQIHCPQIVDLGFAQEDPKCRVPVATVAVQSGAQDYVGEHRIMTGDKARITLKPVPASKRRRMQAGDIPQPEAPIWNIVGYPRFTRQDTQKEIYDGKNPIELKTVVYVLSMRSCGPDPSWGNVPISEVERALFNSSWLDNNLENYYGTCFYNKARFLRENVVILPRQINITCSGRYSNITGLDFDSKKKCGVVEQAAWQRQAHEQLQEIAKTDAQAARALRWYTRRRDLFILPPKVTCEWDGFADVTCTSPTCTAFVKSMNTWIWGSLGNYIIAHESFHNLGLVEAATLTEARGDSSDIMGYFSSDRRGLLCPSAPHLYRIGMAKPLNEFTGDGGPGWYGNLTAVNFTADTFLRLTLPVASQADDHMVVINLGRKRFENRTVVTYYSNATTYYLAYRYKPPNSPRGYDSDLPVNLNATVLIHAYDGVQDERVVNMSPQLITALGNDTIWRSPEFLPYVVDEGVGGYLVVHVANAGGPTATVKLCRATELAETSCYDGQDNDCDGFRDGQDSDCLKDYYWQ